MKSAIDVVVRTLSLCSGVGGLDKAIQLATPAVRTICYVERNAYAAAVLVARMADQALDRAPIWDDLTTFPYLLLRGRIHIIVAGIPCQPYSSAGSRKGRKDKRDLWGPTFRILKGTGAPVIFIENVVGLINHPEGLRRILKDLSSIGFDAEWGTFSNSQVGAPHRRNRLFVLGYAQGTGLETCRRVAEESRLIVGGKGLAHSHSINLRDQPGWGCGQSGQGKAESAHPSAALGNPFSEPRGQDCTAGNYSYRYDPRWEEGDNRFKSPGSTLGNLFGQLLGRAGEPGEGRGYQSTDAGSQLDHTHRQGMEGGGGTERAVSPDPLKTVLPFWPPDQNPENWIGWPEHTWPSLERPIRGKTDGLPDWLGDANTFRSDRLYGMGNAVSPLVGAVAWRVLLSRVLEGD